MKNYTTELTPTIYVACLSAYNNGKLHGVWIDATQEPEGIMEEVKTMLTTSPEPDAEEWAIHSYDDFEDVEIAEWESFNMVHKLAIFISEYGRLGALVLDYNCNCIELAREALEDNYCGEYESLEDYARELTEETTAIPNSLIYYINYEMMARDMEMEGSIFTIEIAYNEIHVFWSH